MAAPTHRRRLIVRAALTCVLLLGFAGCASADLSTGTGPPIEESGYTGPPVTIEYWNGFTGGDGPYMRAMVDEFNATHENITVESNTLGWTDFYQRIVAAVHAGQGPDVAAMQLDNLATQAARSVIVPMEDAITADGLHRRGLPADAGRGDGVQRSRVGGPAGLATRSRRTPTPTSWPSAGVTEQASTGTAFESELAALQEAGVDHAVLDAEPVAGPPDVPQPAVAERGRALLRGRAEGHLQQPGGRGSTHLDGRPGEAGREPDQRGEGLAVPGVQERRERRDLGRHLADQRPQGHGTGPEVVARPDSDRVRQARILGQLAPAGDAVPARVPTPTRSRPARRSSNG